MDGSQLVDIRFDGCPQHVDQVIGHGEPDAGDLRDERCLKPAVITGVLEKLGDREVAVAQMRHLAVGDRLRNRRRREVVELVVAVDGIVAEEVARPGVAHLLHRLAGDDVGNPGLVFRMVGQEARHGGRLVGAPLRRNGQLQHRRGELVDDLAQGSIGCEKQLLLGGQVGLFGRQVGHSHKLAAASVTCTA